MAFHTPGWDLALFHWINQGWSNPLLDVIMPLVSSSLFLWTLAVTLIGVGLRQRRILPSVALGLVLAVAVSDMTCAVCKEQAGRVRPYQSVAGARYLEAGEWLVRPGDFTPTKKKGSSFPSAHAANAVAASLILYGAFRKKSIWILPVVVGCSRIYLGKHFPLDILAGWSVGLGVGWVILLTYPALWSALWSRVFSRWMR